MKKILLIFTGGTICSCPTGKDNKNQSNARMMGSYLEVDYKNSNSPFKDEVVFVKEYLSPDILSENMMVGSWSELLNIFRKKICLAIVRVLLFFTVLTLLLILLLFYPSHL